MSMSPTYFELGSRFNDEGFRRAEQRAKETADRISRMKAELKVGTSGGGSLHNQNILTTEGIGRLAGSVAVVAALDRGMHALAGGLKAYNEAIEKGEDGTRALIDGFVDALPILNQMKAAATEAGKAIDRATVLREQIRGNGGRFGGDIDAEEAKRQASASVGDEAAGIAAGADREGRLVGLGGFAREREELDLEEQDNRKRIAELRVKSQRDATTGIDIDAAESALNNVTEAKRQDIAKREAERLADVVENFFGAVEEAAEKELEGRVRSALDSFFDGVEEAGGKVKDEKVGDFRRRDASVVENRAFTDVTRGVGGDGLDQTNKILENKVAKPLEIIAREIVTVRPGLTS